MALNFSHRPIFPAHISEDNLVSPIRMANGYLVEGIPEKNGDGFGKPWHSNRDVEDHFAYGRDRCERGGSQESVSNDILDLLPSDPFGMDISTTFTAITSWLGDLELDYRGYGKDEVGASDESYQLFAEWNFFLNNAMRFQAFPVNTRVDHKSNMACGFRGCYEEKAGGDASGHGGFGSTCGLNDILTFGNESMGKTIQHGEELGDGNGVCSDGDGAPNGALLFALGYLGVRDLLLVERVCKSLRSTVRSDPLLWRSIHIDQPLNEKITDDVLLQLANRAQGNLQCLSLVECPRITDDGVKRVLESNPRLTKLSVPGCTRLSIEGIVSSLKAFKSTGVQGVKQLRIGGLYGVTEKHFEELKFLLGTDSQTQQNDRKPHIYHRGNFYLSCDDNRDIDIEVCPRCQNLRLVYDCPAEACQGKNHATQVCRACTLCIARCVQCGRCINDSEYEETFCLELLCSDCCKQLQKCQEKQDRKVEPAKFAVHHEQNYSTCLHG
ncbi:F-box protein SKIP14 [Ziziphus jujuba]|uniref:F-box protein SKIP14 n=1 Tax=Ziziphus jujuba TaxID=326968 RepID=A0A6P4AYK7_ZIZJJ|nr:F-box protein SKIP14 [Ziziphus jujuba]XP_048318291.2 F-box protein SKIP14 [Ziziphus jujuba]